MKRAVVLVALLACGDAGAQYVGGDTGIHGTLGSGAAADPTPVFDFDPGEHGSGPSQIAHTVPGFATMTEVIDCDAADHTTSLACDTGGTWTEVTGYGGGGGDITPGWRAPWTEDAATASQLYRAVFRAPNTSVGNIGTQDFIALAVVRTVGNSTAQTLFGNYDSTGPTGWRIEMTSGNVVRGRVNGTTFGSYTLPAAGEYNIYAVAVDHSGGTNGCRFYVNGELAGSAGTCPSASSATTGKNTEIGGRSNDSTEEIDGWFSFARMWTCIDCLTTTTAMDDAVQEMSLRLMGVWPSTATVAKPTTHDHDYPSYLDIMAENDLTALPRRWTLPVGRDWSRVQRWPERQYGAIDRLPRLEGYFPEPLRINIALRSVEFSNATWTELTPADTTQADPFTSVFGRTPADTLEADRLLGDGTNAEHGWRQSITLEASSVYKVSTWVGWESGYKAYAWLRDNTTANAVGHFELDRCLSATAGAGLHDMGTDNDGTALVVDDYGRIPSGFRWCRIAITIDGTAAAHDIDLGWSDADGSTTSASTLNETIGVAWGFQVEKLESTTLEGESPSSFIRTTAASAQRERDYLRFDDDNAPAQGQMECSFLLPDSRMTTAITGNISAVPISIEVDTNNYLLLEQTGEVWGAGGGTGGGCTYDVKTGGVAQIGSYFCASPWSLRDGLRHTMRAVYLPNDARLYVDGQPTAEVTDTGVTLPTLGSGNIAIGYSHVFATQWTRGLIERCRLYAQDYEVTYP